MLTPEQETWKSKKLEEKYSHSQYEDLLNDLARQVLFQTGATVEKKQWP